MCINNKRRNVELDVTYKLVSVYDPEYFELKQKYDELCKAVSRYMYCHEEDEYELIQNLIKLAEKGETN